MTPLLLVVPLVFAAPVPRDFKPANAPLDGTWEFVASTFGGNPDTNYDGAKWVLGKDGKAVRHLRGDGGTEAEYKADPKAKPMAFDWTISGSTFTGIYEVKGDVLTVALPLDGTRPTEFAGQSVYVFTMKKAK